MKRSMFVLAAALLGTGAWAADPSFSFGFEGFQPKIKAPAGTEVTFEGYLTVTSADIPIAATLAEQDGVQGWSYGLQVTGATIDGAATYDPITVGSDPVDTKGLDLPVDTIKIGVANTMTNLWKAGFVVLEAGYTDKAPHAGDTVGAVSAIVLNQQK